MNAVLTEVADAFVPKRDDSPRAWRKHFAPPPHLDFNGPLSLSPLSLSLSLTVVLSFPCISLGSGLLRAPGEVRLMINTMGVEMEGHTSVRAQPVPTT